MPYNVPSLQTQPSDSPYIVLPSGEEGGCCADIHSPLMLYEPSLITSTCASEYNNAKQISQMYTYTRYLHI